MLTRSYTEDSGSLGRYAMTTFRSSVSKNLPIITA